MGKQKVICPDEAPKFSDQLKMSFVPLNYNIGPYENARQTWKVEKVALPTKGVRYPIYCRVWFCSLHLQFAICYLQGGCLCWAAACWRGLKELLTYLMVLDKYQISGITGNTLPPNLPKITGINSQCPWHYETLSGAPTHKLIDEPD